MRRRHAARELHAQVHDGALGAGEEVVEGRRAQHVRHLVRVADRGGDAVRQDAAVELQRRDEGGFDVQMRVDEAGHGDAAAALDRPRAAVVAVGADDRVAADRDVGRDEVAGDEVEEADVADDEVGFGRAAALGRCGRRGSRSQLSRTTVVTAALR